MSNPRRSGWRLINDFCRVKPRWQRSTSLTFYDPEIVFFADELDKYTDTPEFSMIAPDGTTFVTRFASAELNYMTRWILYNGDQQVAAFALPATCRPEGFLAAQRNGTLLQLEPQQTRTFTVTTGIV